MLIRNCGRPESAFRSALLLSLTIHAVIFSLLRFPDVLPKAQSHVTDILTVDFAPIRQQEAKSNILQIQRDDVAETKSEHMQAPAEIRPETAKALRSDKTPGRQTAASAVVIKEVQQPELVTPSPPAIHPESVQPQALNATVLLLIGEDGTVKQIFWKQLPAVTPEELQSMESALRQRLYPATGENYSLSEVVDVPRRQ